MYAIVDVKDKQFKVREDDTLYVPYHSEADVDDTLTLDRVLLLSDEDGDVTLGTPTVEDVSVTARVVDHVKGDKVIVFKKKRRKRYRVKRGHRQQYTQIQIESLGVNGTAAETTEADDTAEDEPASAEAESTEAPASDSDADAEASTAEDAEAPAEEGDAEATDEATDADAEATETEETDTDDENDTKDE
jgi:large subunit ribosomal protein L21